MHGHSYFIAKIGYPEYHPYGTIKASNKDLHEPNCGPPSWKDGTARGICVSRTTVRTDAVIILAGGYVVVHFIQDDPGWWFLNSHIDYHLKDRLQSHVRMHEDSCVLFTSRSCGWKQRISPQSYSVANRVIVIVFKWCAKEWACSS